MPQTVVEVISNISDSRNSISYKNVVNSALEAFSSPASPVSCHQLLVILTDRDVFISDLADVLDSLDQQASLVRFLRLQSSL